MENQQKLKNILGLLLFLSGLTFICAGLFLDSLIGFLTTYKMFSDISQYDTVLIKYVLLGIGAVDIIMSFLFPLSIVTKKD